MIYLNGKKMDDVLPPRSIEDEILFQKIKTLPKQSRHYRVHRRLMWQCSRNIQHIEKSNKLTTVELERSKLKVLSKLQDIRCRRQDIISSGRHSRLLLQTKKSGNLQHDRGKITCGNRAKSSPNIKELVGVVCTENSTPKLDSDMSRNFKCRREQTEGTIQSTRDKIPTIPREKSFIFENTSSVSANDIVNMPPKNIVGSSPEPVKNVNGSRRFTLPLVKSLPVSKSPVPCLS